MNRALCVAINDYHGEQNDLPSCLEDARQIRGVLESAFGFTVRSILDSDATNARVKEGLDWLIKGATSNDRLVFYYSGHGFTKLVDGVMEEYLVLYDGLFPDNELSQRTQVLPAGILTVVLDSCFSGGMQKIVLGLDPEDPVEAPKAKRWRPRPGEGEAVDEPGGIAPHKRFGMITVTDAAGASDLAAAATLAAPSKSASGAEEGLELKGLMISACREDETAAASTSRTGGMSAFTWALLRTLRTTGPGVSVDKLFRSASAVLASAQFRQTPVLFGAGDLKARSFLRMTTPAATGMKDTDEISSDKFWRVVAPVLNSVLPTVLRELVNEKQKSADGDGTAMDPETREKFLGAIASILPHVITAATPVVRSLTRPRRKSGEGFEEEPFDESLEKEKLFRILPAILPDLARALAPAVLEAMGHGRSKSAGDGSPGADIPEEKFLPALLTTIPVIVNAAAPIVRRAMSRGRRKAFGEDEIAVEIEVSKALFGALGRIVRPIVREVSPLVLNAVLQKSAGGEGASPEEVAAAFSAAVPPLVEGFASATESEPADGSDADVEEKFIGPLVDVVRTAAPIMIRAISAARRKNIEAAGLVA